MIFCIITRHIIFNIVFQVSTERVLPSVQSDAAVPFPKLSHLQPGIVDIEVDDGVGENDGLDSEGDKCNLEAGNSITHLILILWLNLSFVFTFKTDTHLWLAFITITYFYLVLQFVPMLKHMLYEDNRKDE